MQIQEGGKAPLFILPANGGQEVNLEEKLFHDQHLILYFYPKDNTPGCTTEAKDFRDALHLFQELHTEVIGISKDSLKSHTQFATSCELPFLLASDADHNVCEQYGVWQQKSFMGKTFMGIVRSTFLIHKSGLIQKIWRSVSVPGHVQDVLEATRSMVEV